MITSDRNPSWRKEFQDTFRTCCKYIIAENALIFLSKSSDLEEEIWSNQIEQKLSEFLTKFTEITFELKDMNKISELIQKIERTRRLQSDFRIAYQNRFNRIHLVSESSIIDDFILENPSFFPNYYCRSKIVKIPHTDESQNMLEICVNKIKMYLQICSNFFFFCRNTCLCVFSEKR